MNTATFSLDTVMPALPEIVLALLTFALLVIDVTRRGDDRRLVYWFSIASLLVGAAICVGMAGWPRMVTFQGLFVMDLMSQVLKAATLVTVAATLMLSRSYLEARGFLRLEGADAGLEASYDHLRDGYYVSHTAKLSSHVVF